MQVVLSLGIVLGAILLLGWLARRLRVMPRGRGGALRVVDEVALGAKERAVILEVDGARLVLGVGEGRVTLLHRGDVAAAPATGVADQTPSGPVPPRFADLLNKALGR
jgi:flagellar protein FliO/FliZ